MLRLAHLFNSYYHMILLFLQDKFITTYPSFNTFDFFFLTGYGIIDHPPLYEASSDPTMVTSKNSKAMISLLFIFYY